MTGLLRFIGLVNAAVWFGAALFFTIAVGPAFFSDEMLAIFGSAQAPYSRAWAGLVAMVVLKRYFLWHYVCAAIGLVHLLAEAAYLGRPLARWRTGLLLGIAVLGLSGGLWMQPKLKELHTAKYNPQLKAEERAQAGVSFAVWHGVSQATNLLMTAGLLAFLWLSASHNSSEQRRPVSPFLYKA